MHNITQCNGGSCRLVVCSLFKAVWHLESRHNAVLQRRVLGLIQTGNWVRLSLANLLLPEYNRWSALRGLSTWTHWDVRGGPISYFLRSDRTTTYLAYKQRGYQSDPFTYSITSIIISASRSSKLPQLQVIKSDEDGPKLEGKTIDYHKEGLYDTIHVQVSSFFLQAMQKDWSGH